MDKNSVDIKEIMTEIKKKAHGAENVGDFAGFDAVSAEYPERLISAVSEFELQRDMGTVTGEYHAAYDPAVDIGSPIRAKLGSMIRVRIAPILEKRNKWCGAAAKILKHLYSDVTEMKGVMERSDPQLLKLRADELELKLHNAMKQIEVMSSRITELEMALEKKGEDK